MGEASIIIKPIRGEVKNEIPNAPQNPIFLSRAIKPTIEQKAA
jgi:hypothetical protein